MKERKTSAEMKWKLGLNDLWEHLTRNVVVSKKILKMLSRGAVRPVIYLVGMRGPLFISHRKANSSLARHIKLALTIEFQFLVSMNHWH